VQNKLLRAVSQQTAAELIYYRANAKMPNMGMQSYDKTLFMHIKKADVSVAKNYLNEDEMKSLGLLVEQYLAFAESMAQAKIAMTMQDRIVRLDTILQLNQKDLLTHAGKISHEIALQVAECHYIEFKQMVAEQEKLQSIIELEQAIGQVV
jgi:hypothetical protein